MIARRQPAGHKDNRYRVSRICSAANGVEAKLAGAAMGTAVSDVSVLPPANLLILGPEVQPRPKEPRLRWALSARSCA
jgi:hypothetical protein